mmetsp:Transcript_15964/g.33346  ORF Transcript_15964/g.33346 Transcript_15964/m.33346 type:complete len:225 (-) Transcript_15964:40-714(-)
MADVVADPSHLLPEGAEEDRACHVHRERRARERAVDGARQERREPGRELVVVAHARLEHALGEQPLPDGAVALLELSLAVVHHVADVVLRKHVLVHARRVVVREGVGGVLAPQVHHGQPTAGVVLDIARHVVAFAVDDDPQVVAFVVLRRLRHRYLRRQVRPLRDRREGRLRHVALLHLERLPLVLAPDLARAQSLRGSRRGGGRRRRRLAVAALAHCGRGRRV